MLEWEGSESNVLEVFLSGSFWQLSRHRSRGRQIPWLHFQQLHYFWSLNNAWKCRSYHISQEGFPTGSINLFWNSLNLDTLWIFTSKPPQQHTTLHLQITVSLLSSSAFPLSLPFLLPYCQNTHPYQGLIHLTGLRTHHLHPPFHFISGCFAIFWDQLVHSADLQNVPTLLKRGTNFL